MDESFSQMRKCFQHFRIIVNKPKNENKTMGIMLLLNILYFIILSVATFAEMFIKQLNQVSPCDAF